MSDERHAIFLEACGRIPFLAVLDRAVHRDLLAAMGEETWLRGSVLVRQGERGGYFRFLCSGRVQVEVVDPITGVSRPVGLLGPGDFFGEIALIRDVPRTATVVALRRTQTLALDRSAFLAVLKWVGVAPETVLEQLGVAAWLRMVPLIRGLSAGAMHPLLHAARLVEAPADTEVIRQGDRGEALYILVSGSCDVLHQADGRTSRVARLTPGDIFGEIALLRGGVRSATVRAATAISVVRVPATAFAEALEADPETAGLIRDLARERLVALRG